MNPNSTYMFVFRGTHSMRDRPADELQQSFDRWMAWVAYLRAKGHYLAGDPLERAPAKVVREPRGGQISDGPFAEAKEIVGGYMLIAAASFEEAVELSRECPGLDYGGSVEVRQIMLLPN